MKKINIGSGVDVIKGWDNLDSHKYNGANIIFNSEEIFKGKKLPFKDNEYDYVLCSHVIEDFLNPEILLDELYRILKNDGILEIRVPHHTSLLLGNFNHNSSFSICKLRGYKSQDKDYNVPAGVNVIKSEYYTSKGMGIGKGKYYSMLCCWICNLLGYNIVETTFIQYVFPMLSIKILYRKVEQ